ncbi:hypothetical protein [Rhizobium sp. BK251]|uniref:hypothetical protein n=1 Tax=Rhizobium sp. BK251 TaxID=2512125 RepID=UPI001043AA10|nr:hypothetical protein [Rhizobium sp. BK251]
MKRNTALKCIGWIATFGGVGFSGLYRTLKYEVWAAVAHHQYDFPIPTSAIKLNEFVTAHPDVRDVSSLITLGILSAFSLLMGAILVALFGEAKGDKPAAPKSNRQEGEG